MNVPPTGVAKDLFSIGRPSNLLVKYTASIPVVLRSLLSSWGRCEPPAGIGQSSGGGPGGEAPGNSQDLVLHDI